MIPLKFAHVAAMVCCGLAPLITAAQQAATTAPAVQTALAEPPAKTEPGSSPITPSVSAATPAASAPAATSTVITAAPAPPVAPLSRDAVMKELADLKARIAELEAIMSAEKDANALRSAEGTDGSQTQAAQIAPAATVTPAAAVAPAPAAPPEISAERTTKEAPFPGDWTWLNSNGRVVDTPMATKYFTPEFRADVNYTLDYNHPEDDSLGGSTETFRSDEVQVEQLSFGGDIRIDNVRGRFLTMYGMFATTTPRNDGSVNRGQWNLTDAYRYVSEAWGGYHWDVNHGLNLDAGIFVSYIGLFSYYNADNWTYQPSFVSSNTPWFFNGIRVQWFPTKNLKIEPWFINGWQSYARYNGKPGLGGQILYRPKPWLDFVWNNYGLGEDDAGYPGRSRIHADYSAQIKVYDKPKQFLDKIAFTITGDLGCEYGGGPASFASATGVVNPKGFSPEMGTTDTYNGGVNCHNSKNGRPKQMFAGWMAYNRYWFKKDRYAITLGGGEMNNPGRYLTLLPPIDGATAVTGTPYYTENAGDRAQMHDGTITFDYMPSQYITFRAETGYRYSDTPYWTGRGGITPPGGNNGSPGQYACANGAPSGVGYVSTSSSYTSGLAQAEAYCFNVQQVGTGMSTSAIWWPDLRTNQTVSTLALMVRF
jgi:hypothetical protein